MSKPPPPPRRRRLPAIAATLAAALLALGAWQGYEAVASQPIARVIYAGEVDRLPQADLEALSQAIQAAHRPGIAALREAARRVPWVRDATVRRRFPDAVEITFQAYDALAHWTDGHLVSPRGEVFAAGNAAGHLPRFRGPEGSAPAMAWTYTDVARVLAPLGSPVAELRLSRRGAWNVVLRSGLTLQLGRGDILPRLERFVAAWPRLIEQQPEPEYVDLRYPNGFATRRAATVTVIKGAGR